MSTLLKDLFTPALFKSFCKDLQIVLPELRPAFFMKAIFTPEWEDMELKQRIRHTSTVLHAFLPADFPDAAELLMQLTRSYLKNNKASGIEYCFLPDYIEQYGLEHPDIAIKAMETITQFITCEFAVRPFLIQHPKQMMAQMQAWSRHSNIHLRRFASEGMRPRLPWGKSVPQLKKDPAPILPILEQLKNDPSEYVRKSVANNLNDIAKDHPDRVIQIIKAWKGKHKNTDWIIKHGSRTLLKQGHESVLDIFGLAFHSSIKHEPLRVLSKQVSIGKHLSFEFGIHSGREQVIRIEYAIFFRKANGESGKKVFKISEKNYSKGARVTIQRKHSFKPITTRRYYPGKHSVALILNGKMFEPVDFQLRNG